MNSKTVLAAATLVLGVAAAAAAPYTPVADGQHISDGATGLIWRRCAEGMSFSAGNCTGTATRMTHDAAVALAAELSRNTGLPWRLPTSKELATIADKNRKNPAIDEAAFPGTPATWFWALSLNSGGAGYAWFIDFYDGFSQVNGNRSGSYYVRLVRSGQRNP